MSITSWLGRMLGVEEAVELGQPELSFSAPLARDGPVWLLLACVALVALVVLFYLRFQHLRRRRARIVLTVFRAMALCLLVAIFAEPTLLIHTTTQPRPLLWLVFDGTDSMGIVDDLPEPERVRLAEALDLPAAGAAGSPAEASAGSSGDGPAAPTQRLSRSDYLKALVGKKNGNLLERLQEKFRVWAFLFDRAEGVRALEPSPHEGERIDPAHLAGQLTTAGPVTALGSALADLARRQSTANLAGVVVFGDFNQNAGPPALDVARQLGVGVYTVGIGPATAVDLAVDLQCPPTMKKDERYPLVASLRQEGLTGQVATVRFSARPLGIEEPQARWTAIDQRTLRLDEATSVVEASYVATQTGRYALRVEVDPFPEEVITENNRAESETRVHDDFLRLLFVEYEPSWEWRFVKEVFHRDKLVGMRGFRTFLRSADPRVRQTNELFAATLSPPRSEFFASDVILLGDMPSSALTPRFCQMTEEFVDKLGGGLVVIAGPRYGPGQLALTPLGDMLPVKVDPNLHARTGQSFRLRRTAEAAHADFMQLDAAPAENDKAWNNLGPLDWYQPVERLRAIATALAEHPTDKCVDAKTPQPLIAMRSYGRGEVVYLGFNETWRLRRLYGERYYRQFWGQLIHRLASRHALGAQKRFVVRTDRRQYQANDQVYLTVEAYDANFRPLGEDKIPGRKLTAEWLLPQSDAAEASSIRTLSVSQLREGLFETRFPVLAGGEHRVRVRDPITQQASEVRFHVTSLSAERQQAVRNATLQQTLADATGGKSYDLVTASRLPYEIRVVPKTESSVQVIPLWNTWPMFILVAVFLLGEWLGRKWVNLP
jgi:hypothetical protein